MVPNSGTTYLGLVLSLQDDEIAELKAKMDDMSEEFGKMLKVFVLLSIMSRYWSIVVNVHRKLLRKCGNALRYRVGTLTGQKCQFNSAWKSSNMIAKRDRTAMAISIDLKCGYIRSKKGSVRSHLRQIVNEPFNIISILISSAH